VKKYNIELLIQKKLQVIQQIAFEESNFKREGRIEQENKINNHRAAAIKHESI